MSYRWLLLISLIVCCLWLIGCGGKKDSNPPPPRGFIFAVQSNPAGAEIWLDGRQTPFHSNMIGSDYVPIEPPLADGQPHLLTLKLSSYNDWHQWVEWTNDASIIVRAQMSPSSNPAGTLTVSSEPEGAKIWVDGVDTGKITPATLTISPTRHALRLTLNNHLPAFENVDVIEGGNVEVHIPLTPQGKSTITGTIFDRFGNAVFGATVHLQDDTGQTISTTQTTAFGAFQFASLEPKEYTVIGEATIESVREIGRLDRVKTNPNQRSLAHLVLFPADLLGSVEGFVRTSEGEPISDAQVALLYYAAGLDFVLTSRRILTDGQGFFHFDEVPATLQVIIGRKEGFQSTQTQVTTRQGETVQVDLTLNRLGEVPSIQPPSQVFAIAETLPTTPPNLSRSEETKRIKYRDVLLNYLRRYNHSAFASLRRADSSEFLSLRSRFFPQGFWAQVEVGWQPPINNPSQALLGYRIYRSNPRSSGWKLRLFVDEPEQTVVADAGFDITAGQTYQYSVSSIVLGGQETEKSEPSEVTVLPPLRLLFPTDNAEVNQSDLTFQWQPVNGQVPFYTVELFDSPDAVLSGDPQWTSSVLSGTTQFTYDGQPLLRGKTYWWIVIGQNARDWREANSFTISEMRRVVIVGD